MYDGIVQVIYGSIDGLNATRALIDQLWWQDSPDVEEIAESNDAFGLIL